MLKEGNCVHTHNLNIWGVIYFTLQLPAGGDAESGSVINYRMGKKERKGGG